MFRQQVFSMSHMKMAELTPYFGAQTPPPDAALAQLIELYRSQTAVIIVRQVLAAAAALLTMLPTSDDGHGRTASNPAVRHCMAAPPRFALPRLSKVDQSLPSRAQLLSTMACGRPLRRAPACARRSDRRSSPATIVRQARGCGTACRRRRR